MANTACRNQLSDKEIYDQLTAILHSTNRYLDLKSQFDQDIIYFLSFMPKNIIVNEADLSYINTSIPTMKSNQISNLKSPKSSFFKSLSHADQEKLSDRIDHLYNRFRRINNEFGDAKIKQLEVRIKAAYSARDHDMEEMASKVVGVYDIPNYPDIEIIISANPFDIFMKSTAQAWESKSCERYGGEFFEGVFSDIENVSLIAFLRIKGNKKPFARIMIRPCIVESTWSEQKDRTFEEMQNMKKWAYGIEKFYYSNDGDGHTLRRSNQTIAATIRAKIATDTIERILKDAGVFDYHNSQICTTPYDYQGYSDVMGMGNTEIRYTKRLVKCDRCKNYYSAAIMINDLCPDCREEYGDFYDEDDEEDEEDVVGW